MAEILFRAPHKQSCPPWGIQAQDEVVKLCKDVESQAAAEDRSRSAKGCSTTELIRPQNRAYFQKKMDLLVQDIFEHEEYDSLLNSGEINYDSMTSRRRSNSRGTKSFSPVHAKTRRRRKRKSEIHSCSSSRWRYLHNCFCSSTNQRRSSPVLLEEEIRSCPAAEKIDVLVQGLFQHEEYAIYWVKLVSDVGKEGWGLQYFEKHVVEPD
ncbi:hypothetical protein SRHO_G00032160 [Serrasalmus rhombeus]